MEPSSNSISVCSKSYVSDHDEVDDSENVSVSYLSNHYVDGRLIDVALFDSTVVLMKISSPLEDITGNDKVVETLYEEEAKAANAAEMLEKLENLDDLDELTEQDDEQLFLDDKVLSVISDDDIIDLIVPPIKPLANNTSFKLEHPIIHHGTAHVWLETSSGVQIWPNSQQEEQIQTVKKEQQQQSNPLDLDVARELAVVDELVRARYEDMQQWSSSEEAEPLSPTSTISSGSSTFGSGGFPPSSLVSSLSSPSSPTYVEDNSDNSSLPPLCTQSYLNCVSPTSETSASKSGHRKSGGRSKTLTIVDRKSRKKEQNKNAATRYRLKKKAEVEVIVGEEKALCDRRHELTTKVGDLQREIRYLKSLMRELFKAKRLIN